MNYLVNTLFKLSILTTIIISISALETKAHVIGSIESVGKFKDNGYNALNTLSQGSYSSALRAAISLPPIVADEHKPGQLFKRACNCPEGFGCCSGGNCCPIGTLCSTSGGCCEAQYPYTCGNTYCCPFQRCTSDGHCGCSGENEVRCGSLCCYNGCSADGKSCACPTNNYIQCEGGLTCCPQGSVCLGNGRCKSGPAGKRSDLDNPDALVVNNDTIGSASSTKQSFNNLQLLSSNEGGPGNSANSVKRTSSLAAILMTVAALVVAALLT